MKLRISATDRIVLKLSKLEFKSTRRKKIHVDFGNELTVLNESSSSRVFVILTNWSFGPQNMAETYHYNNAMRAQAPSMFFLVYKGIINEIIIQYISNEVYYINITLIKEIYKENYSQRASRMNAQLQHS